MLPKMYSNGLYYIPMNVKHNLLNVLKYYFAELIKEKIQNRFKLTHNLKNEIETGRK